MRRLTPAAWLALLATACTATPRDGELSVRANRGADLAGWFDCLRTRGEAVIGAHRAGPASGLPENALTTMAATLTRNPDALLEIDVQSSADGVLFLLHDDRLDRTTIASGNAKLRHWDDLAGIQLRDNDGTPTGATIPRLSEALDLARERGAVVQLDVKRGVDFAAVIAAVRAARAEHHSVIITYRDADALTVARLAPELMISAEVGSLAAAEQLIASGVGRDRLLAWTGIESPNLELFAALRAIGVEPMFGTLGRRGVRLDDRWLADGNASEFARLEREGVVVIATDRGAEVEAAIGPPQCRRQ